MLEPFLWGCLKTESRAQPEPFDPHCRAALNPPCRQPHASRCRQPLVSSPTAPSPVQSFWCPLQWHSVMYCSQAPVGRTKQGTKLSCGCFTCMVPKCLVVRFPLLPTLLPATAESCMPRLCHRSSPQVCHLHGCPWPHGESGPHESCSLGMAPGDGTLGHTSPAHRRAPESHLIPIPVRLGPLSPEPRRLRARTNEPTQISLCRNAFTALTSLTQPCIQLHCSCASNRSCPHV